MKIGELREKIKNVKTDDLQQIIVEMYKQIPKKMREEKEIDKLIEDPEIFKKRKSAKKSMKDLDFSSVEKEVQFFIKNAYEQNYVAPNRTIPKKERSNWRFTAKRLVDQVTSFANHPEHRKVSISLLEELYRLFVYASGHYVFVSDEPFYTLKIPQEDFLKRIIWLKKEIEDPDKWISDSLKLVLECDLDYQTSTSSLLEVILSTLNNAPLKERMVGIAEKLIQEKRSSAKRTKGRYRDWKQEEMINHLVKMVFMTQSALGEYQLAVEFFEKYYIESKDEIKLFILLRLIMKYQNIEVWKNEYERAVKRGIKPRAASQNMYDYIRRENQFPDYIYSY